MTLEQKDEVASAAWEILEGFPETNSRVTISVEYGKLHFRYVREEDEISDEEAIAFFENEERALPRWLLDEASEAEIHEKTIAIYRKFLSHHLVGGDGITARRLYQLDDEMPGVQKALSCVNGKIVFIGNGASPAPLELRSRWEGGEIESPFIVDLFDYPLFQEDLLTLRKLFVDHPYYYTVNRYSNHVDALIDGAEEGYLN